MTDSRASPHHARTGVADRGGPGASPPPQGVDRRSGKGVAKQENLEDPKLSHCGSGWRVRQDLNLQPSDPKFFP